MSDPGAERPAARRSATPGSGWPDDPADASTPIARDARDVAKLARTSSELGELDARVSVCRACPRLVEWREEVARTRRKSFDEQAYWGRPIAGWGASRPKILVVGLAPAAHGGNRTGRIFTGDRSGDWLFAALHRAGLAALATSTHAGDGQRLIETRMVAAVRCAPPANKPTTEERDTCSPWFHRELELVTPELQVVVALGSFAWLSVLSAVSALGWQVPKPRPRFGHGVEAVLTRDGERLVLLGSFHPSQQNTFTGKLTEPMFDAVFDRATAAAGVTA